MGMFHKVQVGEKSITPIDWEMTPDMTFGTFESWGGRERLRNNDERIYYFFVDNWDDEPKLRLMERAVKHAKIIATIDAPPSMVKRCVANQGTASIFEQSYAIDDEIKNWLIKNVLDDGDTSLIIPSIDDVLIEEDMGPALPHLADVESDLERINFSTKNAIINDDQIEDVIKKHNFFDSYLNKEGHFENVLTDSGDGLTVTDHKTGLEWQKGGIDIASIRTMQKAIKEVNEKGFADHNDWRMPTMEEAMSLMENKANEKTIFLNPCFSKEQPFIFVAAQRKPGGYWYVDYKQGRAFWSSGTIPGGFGRLCRTAG